MRKTFGFALVAVALGAAPALAQSTTPTGQTPAQTSAVRHAQATSSTRGTKGTLSAADRAFVREAASGGMAEVELGTLTKDKASSADVKQFGDRMVSDHTKANDDLEGVAREKGLTLPSSPNATDKATKTRLSKLSGDAYDKAYMRDMVKDHEHDVAAFKKEADSGKDPDIKAFAAKTLPTLEDHLKLAKQDAAKVGVSNGSKGQ
jgi:putative membrane protein